MLRFLKCAAGERDHICFNTIKTTRGGASLRTVQDPLARGYRAWMFVCVWASVAQCCSCKVLSEKITVVALFIVTIAAPVSPEQRASMAPPAAGAVTGRQELQRWLVVVGKLTHVRARAGLAEWISG
eukprot:3844026-Amphidinium_carterae.2